MPADTPDTSVPWATSLNYELFPFVDRSAAFAFPRNPPGLIVLGKLDWYLLELFTSRSREACLEEYSRLASINPTAAAADVDRHATGMADAGLIDVRIP